MKTNPGCLSAGKVIGGSCLKPCQPFLQTIPAAVGQLGWVCLSQQVVTATLSLCWDPGAASSACPAP